MAITQDTFFGGTITFGTSTVLSVDILSGSRSGVTVDDIETSHATTSGDVKTYMAADLIEGGTYEFEVAFSPDDDVDSLLGVSNSITITYPVPSGGSTGATVVFTGYINGFDQDLPIDDRMTASLSLKVASDPVHTPST